MERKIKDVPKEVAFGSETCKLIFDCGASVHATGKLKDFKKDTLKTLEEFVYMNGISGVLSATHTGTIHYEIESDNGYLEVLEDTGYYMPKLPCRLFSPQFYFKNKST